MSNIVYDSLMKWVPANRKITASRWVSYNGPCCIHNGQSRPDTRKRAGILKDADGRTSVFCFNCGFRTGWSPGKSLPSKMKDYFSWLGMPQEELRKLDFNIWQLKQSLGTSVSHPIVQKYSDLKFFESSLPYNAKPVVTLLEEGCQRSDFLDVMNYLLSRGDEILGGYDYYWSPESRSQINRRILIPFKWEEKIVGWTGRIIDGSSKLRYLSEVQPHFIFNTQVTKNEWEYLFVCEGPFDAIAISGISTLGDKITQEQSRWIKHTGKTPIIVPDRTNQGGRLVDIALENEWSVSFPRWDAGVKDAADAVKRYGRLYTIWSIIDASTKNRLEIGVKRQSLR